MTSQIYQEILSDGKLHHIVRVDGRVYIDGAHRPDIDSMPEQKMQSALHSEWFKLEQEKK